MAKKSKYAGMWREEQEQAIAAATDVKELDAMWVAWERLGYGREGRIYARIQVRKAELAGKPLGRDTAALCRRVGLQELIPANGKEA